MDSDVPPNPLAEWRRENNYNRTELAAILGCSAASIHYWETTKTPPIRVHQRGIMNITGDDTIIQRMDEWQRKYGKERNQAKQPAT